MWTRKLYTAINVLGLAVGLACVILILLYVRHELSYDTHYTHADRIYRVSADYPSVAGRPGMRVAPNVHDAAAMLEQEFPQQVERAARIWGHRVRLSREDVTFYVPDFRWADPALFEIFDFEWLAGDPRTALAEAGSVVLTASTTARYFGDADPLGQTLVLEQQWPLRVTGVIGDLPHTTHLSADAIASMETGAAVLGWDYAGNWSFWAYHTYVLLREGASIDAMESRLPEAIERHKRPSDSISGMTATKLTDIHLRANRIGELGIPGSMTNLRTIGAIALCILLIACINFQNLSTARSTQRAREVGMRKVAGAERGQLIRQFLGEAVLFAAVATLLAVVLVELLLPPFGAFLGRTLAFDYFAEPTLLVGLALLALIVGVIAGSYPAFYLTAFNPVSALKGDLTRGRRGAQLRSALVVLQFSISITLLIATAVIHFQREYARDLETGFATESVVILEASPTVGLAAGWSAFKSELLAHPGITHVTRGTMRPTGLGTRLVRAEGGEALDLYNKWADDDFFEAYDVPVLAGRGFSAEHPGDRFVPPDNGLERIGGSFVLNELAALTLGWTPEQAIGRWFEVDFSGDFSLAVGGPVIGVVENIYHESIREPLKPVFYMAPEPMWGDGPSFLDASVKLSGSRMREALEHIDETWAAHMPDQPLIRRFLDEEFQALYDAERRQAESFAAFSALAVVIACLGLLGLASFATEQRTKEIGVRKVMGGTVLDIVRLFTGEFGKLVLVANVIAWPVAYVLMRGWLENFAYRIDLDLLYFVCSGLLALAVALATVGTIAARAASTKAIDSLRYE
jgi:putative ABC transport system permease protein